MYIYVRANIYKFGSHVGCDVMTLSTHQGNHPGVLINRAQFGVGSPNNFRSVNKHKPKRKKILASWY